MVFPPPSLDTLRGFRQMTEPVSIRTFGPQPSVKTFLMRINPTKRSESGTWTLNRRVCSALDQQ